MEYLVPLITAFAISAVLNRVIIALRQSWKWIVRQPSQARWHKVSTPSYGGIAMFIAWLVCIFAFRETHTSNMKIAAGSTIIFLLGFVDDARPLPPYVKLIGQIAVACLMVMLDVHLAFSGNPLIYTPLTIIWIIGITNAFNLLDNMDGLSGGIALIAAAVLVTLSVRSGGTIATIPVVIFCGSVLGFLFFNVHPARIFMGDCGSQWIGFCLAMWTIMDSWKSASNLAIILATPVLILAVPIFDTALVTLSRKVSGRPVSLGGKDHSSHRLVALGISQRRTVFLLWGLAIVFGLIAIMAKQLQLETWALIASGAIIFSLILGIFLTDVKVYDRSDSTKPQNIFIQNLLYKRRIVEIFIDMLLIGASYILAYLLQYNWTLNTHLLKQIGETLPLIVGTKLLIMLATGLYRGLWSYIDFRAVGRLIRVCLLSTFGCVLLTLGLYRFEGFSRTLFAIDFVILFVLLTGARALLRVLRESVFAFPQKGLRLMIVGAGPAGKFLLEEIRKNRQWNITPVAILDEETTKGTEIVGVPIVGSVKDLPDFTKLLRIDRIVLTSVPKSQMEQSHIDDLCREANIPYHSMQSLEDSLIRPLLEG